MRIDEVVLHFLEGENEGVEIKLTPSRELNIGRSEESDVFLGEKKISRRHCQIFVESDKVRIVDLESTNGTFVNNKKISEMELRSGDKVKVGSSVIEVKVQSKSKTGEEPSSPKPREKPASKSEPKKAPPKIEPKVEKKPEKKPEKGSSSTVNVDDLDELEDLSSSPKDPPKKQNMEEDSDLVVEYQTAAKEVKIAKEHETSEKIDLQSMEDSSPEFQEIDLDKEESSPAFDLEESDISSKKDKDEASFDKIPEIEEMEVNSDFDVSLDEEENKSPQSSKPLVGDLSSMGLSDLLQNLYQNKKTGVLTLNNGTEGKIYIREGALLGAENGKSLGIKALYRMLTWKSGDFEFQPMSNGSKELQVEQDPIPGSVEGILMEGFRQYDELRKIQKVLPQMEDELMLEDKLEIPISKLHPKVLDVVQLIINHKKMKLVLDLSSFSDLETSKIVFYLIKKKVIRIKS